MVIMWPMRFQSAEEEQLLLPGQLEQRFIVNDSITNLGWHLTAVHTFRKVLSFLC